MSSSPTRFCVVCVEEQHFEVPPCEDGHGEDCLDLACVVCGHAVVVGVLVADHALLLEASAA